MRYEFACHIDPILLATQDLLARIEAGDRLIVSDERSRLLRLIERAELAMGDTDEWKLAKYALCCLIDSQLILAPWRERDWWTNNCLEAHIYGYRRAHYEYYVRANQAAQFVQKDVLEVYYLGVIMGFRGFYDDVDAAKRASEINLPATLENWCANVAVALQLKQGRPQFDDTGRMGGTARPLNGRQLLINMSMVAVLLVALAIGFFYIFSDRILPTGSDVPGDVAIRQLDFFTPPGV